MSVGKEIVWLFLNIKIYEYWRDKAITRSFQVKRLCDCTPEDHEVQVTGALDEIFCWAC